jgi:hypothetical protein
MVFMVYILLFEIGNNSFFIMSHSIETLPGPVKINMPDIANIVIPTLIVARRVTGFTSALEKIGADCATIL